MANLYELAQIPTDVSGRATDVRVGQRPTPVVLETGGQPVVVGAMGWLRDLPDHRDYGLDHPEVLPLLQRIGLRALDSNETADHPVDLRKDCTPIEDQGALGSCTAQAGAGLYEFLVKRAHHREFDLSRLFLYKVTRNLLGWTGDTGAYLRTTMGALALFGMPPEQYLPYVITNFDQEPTPFCYAYAQSFQALVYFRLDKPETIAREALLARIKLFLQKSIPSMFGFTVYDSIAQAARTGEIPFPAAGDRVRGGHAVIAVGYDDKKEIRRSPTTEPTKGALLIRNSWGTGWGDGGYGWLPYEYVRQSMAVDWWSMLKAEWVDTEAFSS